ncbi:TPA: hypothetical protein N0F65_006503 [Lagenidium giganteum]|uniref:MICOS complex subunit MIC60 n=1 Tax=Lagenidium giganteum TaxID=4803 RepID=A0AAV2YN59_9STRA|nr:TPA: hypothetical protein N0F65_006503 [Lagenidium giganteum]
MLRHTRAQAIPRAVRAARLNTQAKPTPPAAAKPTPPPTPAKGSPLPPTGGKPTPPGATPSSTGAGATAKSSSSSSASGGSFFPKFLLFSALSAPAAAAVYVKQNPDWNPEPLKGDENWMKFRELVLGPDANKPEPKPVAKKAESLVSNNRQVAVVTPKPAAKPAQQVATKSPEEATPLPASNEKVPTLPSRKRTGPIADKAEAALATINESKNAAVKKAQQAVNKAQAELTEEVQHVKESVQHAKEAVAEKVAVVEKKVDDATAKARKEITKLSHDADPAVLSKKVDQQIRLTTREILDTLKEESDAAADEMDKNYLRGLQVPTQRKVTVLSRVAQLATEMKHRSKWEAVRMLEALRRMEEDTQKKSASILRKQDELHKEVLARELRLQEEVLSRKAREEMMKLKKDYKDELTNTVNEHKAKVEKELKATFDKAKKAIEDNFQKQLAAKSNELQETLTKERKQRVAELENFRAQLRALNSVLDSSSSYEAFSHQVHKTSVAALALSDRIEAAAPLRAESVITEGAPSVSQLQDRFKTVRGVGRRAAMIPEGSGLIGQLFGGALSYLIILPGGPIEGNDAEAIFSRADYALKAGDIEKAVEEMKGLTGLPADVSKDWVEAAESRLAVEQTAKVVKAHIALLAASCS